MGTSILPLYIIFFIINLVIQIISGAINPDTLFSDLGSLFGGDMTAM